MNVITIKNLTIFSTVMLLALFPEQAVANISDFAKGSGQTGFIGVIIGAVCSGIMAVIIYFKNKRYNELLAKLSKLKAGWKSSPPKVEIEKTYLNVQKSWQYKSAELAKDYMSLRLYEQHEEQIRKVLNDDNQPITLGAELKQATILKVKNFSDASKDRLSILVEGVMADKTIDGSSDESIKGTSEDVVFTELWQFVKEDGRWLLDEIDPSATSTELIHLLSNEK